MGPPRFGVPGEGASFGLVLSRRLVAASSHLRFSLTSLRGIASSRRWELRNTVAPPVPLGTGVVAFLRAGGVHPLSGGANEPTTTAGRATACGRKQRSLASGGARGFASERSARRTKRREEVTSQRREGAEAKRPREEQVTAASRQQTRNAKRTATSKQGFVDTPRSPA
jgi:hypothetical protein